MKKWLFWLIVILAFVVEMRVVIPSGSHYCQNGFCGIYFWGAHEHDGVWHLALINNALTVWPNRFPTFAGAVLSGYNTLLDSILYVINLLTKIPVVTLYFKVTPLLWFGAMILVWKKFAARYSNNKWYLPAILFFVFFGNSFSYFFRLYHEGIIWGASGLLSMQSPQMLSNIQYALTLPLIGVMLILFRKDRVGWKEMLSLAILNFLLMGLKFYAGVIAVTMSGMYALTLIFQKQWKIGMIGGLLSVMGFVLATFVFYNPLKSLGGPSILLFKPMATVHPIIEEAGLFFAPSIANLRNNLYATGGSWRLWLIEAATLGLFVFFNWGTRIIGVWAIKKKPFDVVLITGIITSLLMNILFIQRGEWWNTVQFLYYATFLSNIYAAEILANLVNQGWKMKLVALLIVCFTIPNALDTYRIFNSFPPHSYVSEAEIEALNKLKSLPKGVVLALPINPIPGHEQQLPRPLYNMYDTAYVAAFSGQQTYLNDLVQLRLTGINYENRLAIIKTGECEVLSEIKYVYAAGDQGQLFPWQKCQNNSITEIYTNEQASIYRVMTDTPNQ